MNIARGRELHKAWQDGSIRDAELAELRDRLGLFITAMDQALSLLRRAAKRDRVRVKEGIEAFFLRWSE